MLNTIKCYFYVYLFAQILINNEWVNSASGRTFPTINPATAQKITDVQEGDKVNLLLM